MEGPGVFVLSSEEFGRGESKVEVIMGTASSSSTMEADCKHVPSEYVTAFEHRRAYGLWLEQERKGCTSEEEFHTAVANPTRTEVAPLTSNSVEGATSSSMSLDEQRMIQVVNQQFFEELIKKQRVYPRVLNDSLVDYFELDEVLCTSEFIKDFGGRLALGKKIAQGGQAEIYEALFDGEKAVIHDESIWHFTGEEEVSLVLRVFPVEHSEWFRGAWANESKNIYLQNPILCKHRVCCFVINCTLLQDGRFAILMRRYWGDLRKAINIQIVNDKTHLKPLFPSFISTHIMYHIAQGMCVLHKEGTLHTDLKAINVLVGEDIEMSMRLFENGLGRSTFCEIADYESVGVMGTGFWRAPEVLQIMSRAGDKYTNPMTWTEKVDVYSFAFTCYEVLTNPFPISSCK